MTKKNFPFTAIVGQELMKKSLILNLINPLLGGVLIRGEKGTAKSTAVRALAGLMPPRRQVDGCRFNCNPDDKNSMCAECKEWDANDAITYNMASMRVVDLPVSATEDRVVGTLDIEQVKNGLNRGFCGDGHQYCRARRDILQPSGALRDCRNNEPGGGRSAASVAGYP